MYNKILNIILSWIFPEPKETKGDKKILKTITEYFLIVNEVPCDEYRIEFSDKDQVLIYLIYDSVEDAYHNTYRRSDLKEDMGNMFPYTFFVISLVSE